MPVRDRMATTMVNGGPITEANPTVTMPGSGKQQKPKPTATGGKAMDTSKKQASNPTEGAQR